MQVGPLCASDCGVRSVGPETEVDSSDCFVPAGSDVFRLCVEPPRRVVEPGIAEDGVLPSRHRIRSNGYRYWDVDPHHACTGFALELAGGRTGCCEDGGAVSVLVVVNQLQRVIQCVD